MSATVSTAPAFTAAKAGFTARLSAMLGNWFASRQTLCDLALLADEDLAHLGVSRREIAAIRLAARVTKPAAARPAAPAPAPEPLRAHPFSMLTSAALRR